MVFNALKRQKGGEIYIPKLPSYKISDMSFALEKNIILVKIGIRESEKLHETLITLEESRNVYDYGNYYIIYPFADWWTKDRLNTGGIKRDEFIYESGNNEFLTIEDIEKRLKII